MKGLNITSGDKQTDKTKYIQRAIKVIRHFSKIKLHY